MELGDFSAVEGHVSAMLAEAKSLHQAAIAQIHSPHDNPLPRLQKALKLLEEASVLAEDSASYIDSAPMQDALKLLYQQQGQLLAMIAQVESKRPSAVSSPSLLLCIMILVAFCYALM